MSDTKLIPATVLIGDRSYRVRVEAHEEENLRKTVKMFNEKILEFKTTLAGKDMQDYISMVMLWFATQDHTGLDTLVKEQETTNELEKIERLLDKALT